jgi:hypothetical protein
MQPTAGPDAMTRSQHVYEVRPRKDHRGVDLISDVLPFGRLWYGEPNAVSNAIGYAKFRSRSHDAVIRVYDEGKKKPALPFRTVLIDQCMKSGIASQWIPNRIEF